MNEQKKLNSEPTTEIIELNPKRSWWKYVAGVTGVIVFVLGGYVVWGQYFSSEAKYRQEVEKSALALPAKLEAYKKAMEADVYGGKTPEETLQLFIDALKKGDVELASKYFALDHNTARVDPTRLENLKKAKEEGRIPKMIDILSKAQSAGSPMEGYYGFEVMDENGELVADISMRLNKHSGVWKIKSL